MLCPKCKESTWEPVAGEPPKIKEKPPFAIDSADCLFRWRCLYCHKIWQHITAVSFTVGFHVGKQAATDEFLGDIIVKKP